MPRHLAILNPAFFDLLRPSLVHVVLSFLSTRILKKFSRVQVAPEIKASFKEQRSRRRAPIKMMKIFNFYLGILVRTRVYTNTDLMGLSVCVLYCFFFFFFYIFFYVYIMSAFQNSTRWVSAKGLQSRQYKHRTTRSWTSHPDAHTMSGFNGVSRVKHGKRILTHG